MSQRYTQIRSDVLLVLWQMADFASDAYLQYIYAHEKFNNIQLKCGCKLMNESYIFVCELCVYSVVVDVFASL